MLNKRLSSIRRGPSPVQCMAKKPGCSRSSPSKSKQSLMLWFVVRRSLSAIRVGIDLLVPKMRAVRDSQLIRIRAPHRSKRVPKTGPSETPPPMRVSKSADSWPDTLQWVYMISIAFFMDFLWLGRPWGSANSFLSGFVARISSACNPSLSSYSTRCASARPRQPSLLNPGDRRD